MINADWYCQAYNKNQSNDISSFSLKIKGLQDGTTTEVTLGRVDEDNTVIAQATRSQMRAENLTSSCNPTLLFMMEWAKYWFNDAQTLKISPRFPRCNSWRSGYAR